MKELKDFAVAGKSTFISLSSKLPAQTALAMFAGNSSAMRAGIESEITSIDYEEVGGLNTPKVQSTDGRGQVVTIDNEEVQLAKDGETPKAVTIRFKNGITMTLGLLFQGQEKTTIHFTGDGAPTKVTDLTLEDLANKLIGKTFKCAKYYRDATNPIVRNGGQANERTYAANVYEFIQK